MNEEKSKLLMEQFGIPCEMNITYCYKQHRYENLEQAIDFARIDAERNQEAVCRRQFKSRIE